LVVACLFLAPENSTAAGESAGYGEFYSVMPARMRELAEFFDSRPVAFESVLTSRNEASGKISEARMNARCQKNGSFHLLTVERVTGGPEMLEYCYGLNSKYCFELRKNKSRQSWLVSRFVDLTPNFDEAKQGFTGIFKHGFRPAVDGYLANLTAVHMAQGPVLPANLTDLPGFELKSLCRVGPGEKKLRAAFDFDMTDPVSSRKCKSDCLMDFDTTNWTPVRLEQTYKVDADETVYTWQQEFAKTGSKNYHIKLAIDSKTCSQSFTKFVSSSTSDLQVRVGDIPESEFTLSAFGLPEPPGVDWRKPFPYHLWTLGVGAVGFAGFFMLRWAAKRRTV
jgi:hypothetical protein